MGREVKDIHLPWLIHEFQRQFGPIEVHLLQAGTGNSSKLSWIASRTCLGAGFREALYQHTEGHALCTVEMLRDMQERGDLVQNEAGCWVEGSAVDWAAPQPM